MTETIEVVTTVTETMYFIYAVIGFRYTAIVSVIVSVEQDKSLFRSLFRFLSTFKMSYLTLRKSLFRRANILSFLLTETMANFKVFSSPCSKI
jgi:hypothetical protein